MPGVESTIEIDAAPAAVWALMCDTNSYEEWVVPTDAVLDPGDGDMRVGFVYRERGGIPPFKGESTWQVTEFEPHSRQRHVGDDGKAKVDLQINMTPAGAATRVHMTLEVKPRWYLAPVVAVMWPLMVKKRAQESLDGTLANAKRRLEG